MITVALKGGLGNQLFQIAAALSYAIDRDIEAVFPYSEILRHGTPRPTYWNNLLASLKPLTATKLPKISITYREPHFHYQPIPDALKRHNVMLDGYFQSHRYFQHNLQAILEKIRFREQQREILEQYYGVYLKAPVIAIHFRIGDYAKQQHNHPVQPAEYYIRAIRHFQRVNGNSCPSQVLVFYQQSDVKAATAKMQEIGGALPECRLVGVDTDISDWQQLLLMSLCPYIVIANSSFSWWAAYLGGSVAQNQVCYPTDWFGPNMRRNNTRDLFPEGWTAVTLS